MNYLERTEYINECVKRIERQNIKYAKSQAESKRVQDLINFKMELILAQTNAPLQVLAAQIRGMK